MASKVAEEDGVSLLASDEEVVVRRRTQWRRVGVVIAGSTVGALAIGSRFAGTTSSTSRKGSPHSLLQLAAEAAAEAAEAAANVSAQVAQVAQNTSAAEVVPAQSSEPAVQCSYLGQDCNATKCCADPGMQCYAKDDGWAECKADCIPGPDPSGQDGWPWSCKKIGERAKGDPPVCSAQGEDCSTSRCCQDPGFQCYEKSPGWAACKVECWPGMDLTDADSNPWTCKEYGMRTPGVADWVASECPGDRGACFGKLCCSVPGQICYEKDEYYGECATECKDGWSCKTRGRRTPQPAMKAWDVPQTIADWVTETCSKKGEDCSETKCCAEGGNQCFQKNSSWAQCKPACIKGPDLYDKDSKPWTCDILGPKTPGWASEPWKDRQNVSAWVQTDCAEEFSEDCRKSGCCKKEGNQCFAKDENWAACSPACVPGKRPGDTGGGNWSCDELGPRTMKPWGTPSLFCFSVVQPEPNYEAGLMASTLDSGFGIWACDEYATFSTERFLIGDGPDGPVWTNTFVPAPIVESKDHTSGNAELFMHVWDAMKSLGKYQSTDWTVKVDPDAVLLPERLRWHLEPHTGKSTFIINCAKPYMPEGPMMFGALEAISRQGLDTYFVGVGGCTGAMPWKEYGEDLFMGKCLEFLGVERSNDFEIYSDGVCRGVDCTDPKAAAFHPKKDPDSWRACLEETKNPVVKPTTDAPQWFKDYMRDYAR